MMFGLSSDGSANPWVKPLRKAIETRSRFVVFIFNQGIDSKRIAPHKTDLYHAIANTNNPDSHPHTKKPVRRG
jgi:hypothetical protein